MTLIIVLVALAFILSSRTVRFSVPFESFVAVGLVGIVTMALFELGRLG